MISNSGLRRRAAGGNRSEIKVEPLEKIALQVQNQSEVKVEPNSGPYKRSAKRARRHTSDHRAPHVPPDEIDLKGQNRSEVKAELNWDLIWGCAQRAPPRHTSDHRAPHVPPDEIDLETQNRSEVKVELNSVPLRVVCLWSQLRKLSTACSLETQNRSEVKVEPPEKIALQVQNQSEVKVEPYSGPYKHSASWPPRNTSDHRTPYVPPDEIALELQNRFGVKVEPPEKIALQFQNRSKVKVESKLRLSVKDQINEKTTEWALLITSVLLEAMSAIFDQVGHALMGMVIAFLALFLSSLDLICKARKEVKRSPPCCLYTGSSQPFGGLLEYFGLAAAVWQCFYSTMEYLYTRKNQQNPIKMCLLPFIFASCVLIFRLIKRRT